MFLDLDTVIFIGFLAINLAVGLFYSRGIKSTAEYAIGKRDFSTMTVTTSIVSTIVGGGTFSFLIAESYKQGLSFIIPAILGDAIGLIIIGYFIAPRCGSFFNDLSVAEAMGKIYGRAVQICTAISSIFLSIGLIALQLKAAALVMQLFFNITEFFAITLASSIVIAYSFLGGIKSVTLTDILQFFAFAVAIPFICIVIWQTSPQDTQEIFKTLSNSPSFNFKGLFDINNPLFVDFIYLFLILSIPALQPVFFQRINIAQNLNAARKAFIKAGLITSFIYIITCWTGVLLFIKNPNLNPDKILIYIINTYTHTGLRGLMGVAIISTIMSTVDSYLNSTAVIITRDIFQSDAIVNNPKKELLLLRSSALIVGISATLLNHSLSGGFFSLVLQTLNFYMPIVTVPLICTILGFYSNTSGVLLSMLAGLITSIFFDLIPGMTANLVIYTICGLINKKTQNTLTEQHTFELEALNKQRRRITYRFFAAFKNFSFARICKQNFSKADSTYTLVGLFAIVGVMSTFHLSPQELQISHGILLNWIYYSTLICSFILLTYPIWNSTIKGEWIAYFRMGAVTYILGIMPFFFVIVSNFGQFQLMMFLVNVVIIALLVQWQLAAGILGFSIYCSQKLYKTFIDGNFDIEADVISPKLQVIYVLILISSALFAFLKPKQEEAELAEEVAEHLSHIVEDQSSQIYKLSTLKRIFLMNLQHETNTPITGVYSMSQALGDCYDKLTDEERKKAIATITSSSERLISYANNLIDVSKLMSSYYNLKVRSVNLSDLLEERIRKCKKLYIPRQAEEDRDIIVNIEPNLKACCDEYFIKRSFENLIINAIQYCRKGIIVISLTQNKDKGEIEFTVKDSGIGVPQEELNTIFDPFVTSSKTTTPAGGRGMGLTLVKAVAEAHKGSISVKSEEAGGSIFILRLPQNYESRA